jgi:hypothetical protein
MALFHARFLAWRRKKEFLVEYVWTLDLALSDPEHGVIGHAWRVAYVSEEQADDVRWRLLFDRKNVLAVDVVRVPRVAWTGPILDMASSDA